MTDFLLEIVKRWGAKTPYFFRVLRWLTVIIAVVTGLPEVIAEAGIDLPDAIDVLANKVVAIAATIGAIISQLTATTEEKTKREIKD